MPRKKSTKEQCLILIWATRDGALMTDNNMEISAEQYKSLKETGGFEHLDDYGKEMRIKMPYRWIVANPFDWNERLDKFFDKYSNKKKGA